MTHPGAVVDVPPASNFLGSPIWTRAFLLTPEFCDCSYHGTCAPSAFYPGKFVCECDPGWTGFSDFMDARGASCHVNLEAIRYLWVANLCLWAIVLISSAPMIYSLLRKHQETKTKLQLKGRSYRIWDNKGLLSLIVGLVIATPALILVAVLKIAFPDARVGMDGTVTFFWFYGRFGLSLSTTIHQPALMKQMLRAKSVADSVVAEYDRYGRLLAAIQASGCIWAIPVLATRGLNVELDRACFSLFCFQIGLSFLLYYRQAKQIKVVLHKILTDSAQSSGNQNLLDIRDKLCRNQERIQKQTFVQTLIYLIFACVPMLWLAYDYMLPISWLTPPLLVRTVTVAIYEGSQRKEHSPSSQMSKATSRQRDGNEPVPFGNGGSQGGGQSYHTSLQGDATVAVEVDENDDHILLSTGPNWNQRLRNGVVSLIKGQVTPIAKGGAAGPLASSVTTTTGTSPRD
jgi:hypothetical protein